MARLSEWQKLEIAVRPDRSVSIVAHVESFGGIRELALVLEAEIVGDRFVAEYERNVVLEIVPVGSAFVRATYRKKAPEPRLRGEAALIKWGARWKDGILLAQFHNQELRSGSGEPLGAGWHEFPSEDFVVHA